jgi:hypothetical protein
MSNGSYYRLSVRFTNGETERYIVREPIDGGKITDTTRFAIVRTRRENSDELQEVFVATLADVSFIKTQRIEEKDMRHRVAGITGSIGFDDHGGPETIATIEFI